MTGVRDTQEYLDVWATLPPPPIRVTQEYLDVWTTRLPAPVLQRPGAVLARGGAVYLDSFLEYDGRHVGTVDGLFPGTTVRLSGGTTWGAEETLTLQSSATVFVVGDIGNVVILHGDPALGGSEVRFTIVGFSAGTVTGMTDVMVPMSMRAAALDHWDKAVDVVAGLEHLEGCKVGILADNHVVGSPNNAAITIRTVASGRVALGDFYSHVYVGLPYLADLETLDIDKPSGSTLKGSKMAITRVGLMVMQSRSVWVGGQPPTDDAVNPLEGLQEMPAFGDAGYEELTNEYEEVNVEVQRWNGNGRVFVRSVDPTPATILAAIPQGFIPPTQ